MMIDRTYECQKDGNPGSLAVEELLFKLRMADGTYIAVRNWFNSEAKTRAILLVLHGMCGHGGYYKYLAEKMAQYGLMIVAPDYRGHGYSEGKRGDLEISLVLSDLYLIFTYLSSKYPTTPKFILGESMGGCIAVNFLNDYEAGELNHEIKLKGLILFSPGLGTRQVQWESISLLGRLLFRLIYNFAPAQPVLNMDVTGSDPLRIKKVSVRYIDELFKCMDRATFEQFEKVDIPIIIFHGSNDETINLEVVRKFHEDLRNKDKELVVVRGGSHCLFNDEIFANYFEMFSNFILSRMIP